MNKLILPLSLLPLTGIISCTYLTDPAIVDPQPGGPQGQLYQILTDSLESENLYLDNPDKVKSLQKIFEVAKDTPDRMRIE